MSGSEATNVAGHVGVIKDILSKSISAPQWKITQCREMDWKGETISNHTSEESYVMARAQGLREGGKNQQQKLRQF